jgi:predicted DsbA family dithiol-disulfide isomerase
VRLAQHMAIASERITCECIEATEFPDLSQRYRVMAVPKIVINDKVEFEGALPERDFLSAVLRAVDGDKVDGDQKEA